jgi:Type I phosphodiesterase / nucleotide pyrophosphatase
MISVDGMAPYYYTAAEALGVQVPNLKMLKSGGAYAEGVEGVYPTLTYPSHTTLVRVCGPRPMASSKTGSSNPRLSRKPMRGTGMPTM